MVNVANKGSRERAVARPASSTTWITTWCSTASAQRERQRYAKKTIEAQSVHTNLALANPINYLAIPSNRNPCAHQRFQLPTFVCPLKLVMTCDICNVFIHSMDAKYREHLQHF